MYLPFLRGKLYELKAIREFIEESYGREYGRYIMPIIEPVNKDIRPLMSCVEAMGKAQMPFAVVMNSRSGDFLRAAFDINSIIEHEKIQNVKWTPAFEMNGNSNVDAVERLIDEFGFAEVMLIFFTVVDLDDEKINRIVTNKSVKYIVAMNLAQRPLVIQELKSAGKEVVIIEDSFPEKSPNNAYRENPDEFFSDTFNYYKSMFGFYGFSDFTTLARNFRQGGTLPQVVAIHMTYQKSDKVVNVHHFLSDSRNGTNDIRGEFAEANMKIPEFYNDKISTLAIRQISGMGYPGLGAIKKFSIKNHFELISRILHDKENRE